MRMRMLGAGAGMLLSSLLFMGATGLAQSSSTTPSLRHLPLKEILAPHPADSVFAVFITGDGGWASIDDDLTDEFARHGMNVIGLDSRSYLRTKRTPDEVARDVAQIIRHYQAEWHCDRFVLVGYSRGADLAPFIVSRLDSTLRRDLAFVAMIGLGVRAGFEFHFEDIFRDVKREGDLPTLPELEKSRGVRMACVYGTEEKESGCRDASEELVTRIERPGGHHFDDHFREIADLILKDIRP